MHDEEYGFELNGTGGVIIIKLKYDLTSFCNPFGGLLEARGPCTVYSISHKSEAVLCVGICCIDIFRQVPILRV